MRKPKPPTPRSVSATLRTAGFRAIGKGDEGYEVAWWDGDRATSGPVHVAFFAADDGSTESRIAADELCAKALATIASALRSKSWAVAQRGRADLIVTGG